MSKRKFYWFDRSIQWKMSFYLVLITAVTLAGFATFNYQREKEAMTGELESLAVQSTSRLAENLIGPLWNLDKEAAVRVLQSEMLNRNVHGILVYDADGQTINSGLARDEKWAPVAWDQPIAGSYAAHKIALTHEGEALGEAAVYLTDRFMRKEMQDSLYLIIGMSVAQLVLLATVLILLLTKLVVRPVRQAVKMSDAVAEGDLSTDLNITTRDEIGALAASLNRMSDSLRKKAVMAEAIAGGDLTHRMEIHSDRDRLGKALLHMLESLNQIVEQVKASAVQVAGGAGEVADSSQSLSHGASRQAASLEEITSSITELASQTQTNADHAAQVGSLVRAARESGEQGSSHMQNTISAMGQINDSSREIAKIIKAIDDIAFQTNLLALNAAVEAARAGKHGKGFSVVAQEVRNLAGRSAQAARETAELIDASVKRTEAGTKAVEQTATALSEIVDGVIRISSLVDEITAASREQAEGIGQINIGLGQVDEVTQQNTAFAEETAAASEELSGQSEELLRVVGKFRVNADAGDQWEPAVDRPDAMKQLPGNGSPELRTDGVDDQEIDDLFMASDETDSGTFLGWDK